MKKFLIIATIIVCSSLTGVATLQYAKSSNNSEVHRLEGRISDLESELFVEKGVSSYLRGEATNSVSLDDYQQVIDQYNELVAKYNALANNRSYTSTYNPINCTSNTYFETTYTNCY